MQCAAHEHRPALLTQGIEAVDLERDLQRRLFDDVAGASSQRDPRPARGFNEAVVDWQHQRKVIADNADPSDGVRPEEPEALLVGEFVDPRILHCSPAFLRRSLRRHDHLITVSHWWTGSKVLWPYRRWPGTRLALVVSDNLYERESGRDTSQPSGAVDLYWIPLGAGAGSGAQVVRVSGTLFEAVSALVQRRARCALYHSALEVRVPEGRFVIEQAPIPDLQGEQRGVVAEGPVGTRWAGRFRGFRYEIRRWRDGRIPDVHEAIASPVRLTDDLTLARRILDLLPSIPTPVWGRDEFDAGEMWNSNSVISWVLARSGADIGTVHPPSGGRAPGWDAGFVVAARDLERAESRQRREGKPLSSVT